MKFWLIVALIAVLVIFITPIVMAAAWKIASYLLVFVVLGMVYLVWKIRNTKWNVFKK